MSTLRMLEKCATNYITWLVLTNTVEIVGVQHRGDVLRKALAAAVVLGSIREPSGVTPATDGNHDLGVSAEALAHSVHGLEWRERRRRVRVEQLRRGECHDCMINLARLIASREIDSMISMPC